MVRVPLTPDQLDAGRRLGEWIKEQRAGRDPDALARVAGLSPETLRKIEAGRIPSPGFGTVVSLCQALDVPVESAVAVWQAVSADSSA